MRGWSAVILLSGMLVASGCAALRPPSAPARTATAEVRNAKGQVVGTATLTQVSSDGVRVLLEVKGLPAGPKGVHVHEVGECEPSQFASAGGHFNPTKMQHGLLNPDGPHAGDLPNITIAADGTGRLESLNARITLHSGATSVFAGEGSALVIHAAPDDFTTDPAGNSGPRIACGVITKTR
jgi:Cu-Zn family superoxide dismutase